MENFDEKTCLCALNRIFGFEPKIALALVTHLGSAQAVFNLSAEDMETITGPFWKYKGKICREALEKEAAELESLSSRGITFCGWSEDDYPALLRECDDPPLGIYIRSETPLQELWKPDRRISIVGTRDISPYGREWTERIVDALGKTMERPVIVSGLALGTDITAHLAALRAGLPTIGVLATGPEAVYPYRHRETAETIVRTPGCALITDYPPHTAPLAIHFIRRNRLIAALSQATILIESKIKGGGMATCRLASSYNRDIHALPGRVDDVRSMGCNDLIRRKIAEPITSLETLIDSLDMKGVCAKGRTGVEATVQSTYSGRLSEEKVERMARILKVIKSERGISVEDLAVRTGYDIKTTTELTGMLEIDGIITIDLLKRCSINYKIL